NSRNVSHSFSSLMIRPHPRPPLFPYTTLFRSLIDWERGILAGLAPLVAKSRSPMSRDQILESFAREESAQEEETPAMLYSQLLGAVYKRLARSWGVAPSDDGANTFGASVPDWPEFP